MSTISPIRYVLPNTSRSLAQGPVVRDLSPSAVIKMYVKAMQQLTEQTVQAPWTNGHVP